MENQRVSVPLRGIVKDKPQLQSADGDCEEIINLRFIDNAWRGVGAKDRLPYSIVSTKIYSKLISPYILPDGTFVGFCSSDNSVYLIVTDGDNESNEQLLVTLGSGDVFKSFAWMNNTLIVYSYNNLVYLQYLPNSGTFIVLPDLAMPKLAIGESSPMKLVNYQNPDGINVGLDPIAFESYLQYTASQLQVKYALARSDGYFHGNVSFYFAYRLFDGSYIKHSGPYIWNVAWDINMRPFLKRYKIDGVLDYWETGIYLNFPTAYLEFNTQQLSTINDYNKAGIIQSLCIFMSSTKETYNIGAELSEWNVFHESGSYYYYPPLNDDAKIDISDVANHFLVKELTINELIDNSTSGAVRREVIILKDNELSTIETNPVMPIDNFSIHKLIPSTHYQYNSRLHLGDLKIIMGDMPSPFIPHFFDTLTSSRVTIAERDTSLEDHYFDNNDIVTDNSPLNGMDLYLHAELLSDGKRYMTLKKLDNAEISLYHKNVGGADEYSMPLRPLFGYPDTRAVKFSLLANKPSQGTHFRVVSSPAINGSKATALLIIYDNYDSSGICSIVAGTTIQIGNTTLTCVGIGATPGDYEFNENASIPTTRNNILACIAAMPTVGTVFWVASAGAYSNTIDFIARQTGEQSNTYTTKVLPSQGTRFQESTFVGGSDTFDSLKSFPLSKVLFQNVSLYDGPLQSIVDGAYLPIWLKIPVENTDYNNLPIYDEPIAWVNDWQEPNRIQVSEVNNLFLYPAKQSYRVGNPDYTIRAMIVAQEPLTEMQFGQFPLYTFTAGGVYALEYGGGGEVLYSRITQFLTDVIREGAIPVALAGGAIVYQELSAVKVLIGREAKDISRPVIANSKNPLYLDAHLVNMTDNPELSELRAVLDDPASTMQMDDFILNSLIGYDHTRKEILFTGNGNYTLVYQLISGAWYKRTDMFDNYLHETGGHLGMVREVAVTDVDIPKYGLLYNWYAATDVRGITSGGGWVVPEITDFQTLKSIIGSFGGLKLRESGNMYWYIDDPQYEGLNTYNFNGRGIGSRIGYGFDGDIKRYCYFITTDVTIIDSTEYIRVYYLSYSLRELDTTQSYVKISGLAIRLFRPATVAEQLLADGTACEPYEGNDGTRYRTVKIGTQVWTADNLCETQYRNGETIPEVTDNTAWAALETGALCAYDNDWSNAFTTEEETTFRTSFYKLSSEVETAEGEQSIMQKPWIFAQTRPFSLGQLSYKHIERIIARFMGVNFVVREIDHIDTVVNYGLLYNWYAATDARGFTSAGDFVVPGEAEIYTFHNYLIDNYSPDPANKIKDADPTYWNNIIGGTNDLGFNARGSGTRYHYNGEFSRLNDLFQFGSTYIIDTGYSIMWVGGQMQSNFSGLANVYIGDINSGNSIRLMRLATEAEQLLADGTACADYVGNDGKIYPTVKIGTQVWTAANSCETLYRDGSQIYLISNPDDWVEYGENSTGAMCFYDNNPDNGFITTPIFNELFHSKSSLFLFGSVNGKAWNAIAGIEKAAEWFEIMTLSRTSKSYQYFIIAYAGRIENSELKNADVELQTRFNNRLR